MKGAQIDERDFEMVTKLRTEEIWKYLTERERQALTFRFGLADGLPPLRIENVSFELRTSRERAGELIQSGLQKLRRFRLMHEAKIV